MRMAGGRRSSARASGPESRSAPSRPRPSSGRLTPATFSRKREKGSRCPLSRYAGEGWGEGKLLAGKLRPHGLEDSVPADERVEERCGDVHEDQSEEDKRQIEMRIPERRVQAVALRQDLRQIDAAPYLPPVRGPRDHPPADKSQSDHQGVERIMRKIRRKLHRL